MLAILLALSAGSRVPAAAPDWTGLHVRGEAIVDQYGHKVLLRGFGPGEWTNTEAYMIRWPDQDPGAGRHEAQYGYTAIHATLTSLMGARDAERYWRTWQAADVTEADVARMQAWGANSLRLSINYHWLSTADGVYLAAGWQWIDRIVGWCRAHHMRVILCLHAAPGAQSNYLMADTPDVAAHLWTQPAKYQPWTIHLWQAIAQRYASDPSVAGYDLLDEPIPPAGRGRDVRDFYVRLTKAIRAVDEHHIIFVEGLHFAGDAAGMRAMLPPWDDNLVLVFHKYWDRNDRASIAGYLAIRRRYHVPLWNGESGENTVAWQRGMVQLLARNDIGWNSWTYKKVNARAAPYSISPPAGYGAILAYVRCLGPGSKKCIPPPRARASAVMLQLANNAATANCTFESAVVAALFGDAPTFALSVNPVAATVRTGSHVAFDVAVEPFHFGGSVRLGVSGLPASASATIVPAVIRRSGTARVTVFVKDSSVPGTYSPALTGTSSASVRSVDLQLTIRT